MKNATKIIIVRHGQSLGNLNKQFLGHTDLDLSDLGYKQAICTANHLKNEKIDIVIPWVDGSDEKWLKEKNYWYNKENPFWKDFFSDRQ